jgi:hypothetical protein
MKHFICRGSEHDTFWREELRPQNPIHISVTTVYKLKALSFLLIFVAYKTKVGLGSLIVKLFE